MRKKIFKTLSFAGLAVIMATAGVLAFAPFGVTASQPPTTTTGLGLDPKNDPVVYTTESGLEIRMSNANKFAGSLITTTNKGLNYTQDLSSFYYFTMGTFSGTIYTAKTLTDSYKVTNEPVNWIILGVGSHTNAFIDSVSNYLFSTIKNNDYLFSNGEYFFDNQHETYSPAGQLINSTISGKTYIMGKVKDSIKVHTDIPKGCMLVLSEKLLGQMYFNSSRNVNYALVTETNGETYTKGTGYYGNRYRYQGDISISMNSQTQTWNNKPDGSLYTYINNLFNKNTSGAILTNNLGFTTTQANLIVPQQLYTYYNNAVSHLQETPSTDGGTYYTMFPLAYRNAYTSIYQNFCIEDYLPTNSQNIASLIGSNQTFRWGLRSGSIHYQHTIHRVSLNGSVLTNGCENSFGVRPAMVMKLS